MSNFKAATREAMNRCGETCPAVDSAFQDLVDATEGLVSPALLNEFGDQMRICCERVKEKGTTVLRDALIEACGDLLDAEARISRLEHELSLVNA